MPSSSLYRRLAPVALVVGCVFLLSAFASVNASTTLTKNVKATLKTSWQGFPLAMEASYVLLEALRSMTHRTKIMFFPPLSH